MEVDKREEHELVTWGVYAFVRHPGYLGIFFFFFFYLNLNTQ